MPRDTIENGASEGLRRHDHFDMVELPVFGDTALVNRFTRTSCTAPRRD